MNNPAPVYIEDIANPPWKPQTNMRLPAASDPPPITTGSTDIASLVTLMRSSSTNFKSSAQRQQQPCTAKQPDRPSHRPTMTTPWGSVPEGSHHPDLLPIWDQGPRVPNYAGPSSSHRHHFGHRIHLTHTLDPQAPDLTATTPARRAPTPTDPSTLFSTMGIPNTIPEPHYPAASSSVTSENRVSGRRSCATVGCTTTANIAVKGTTAERQNGGWLCSRHSGELGMNVTAMYLDWFNSPYRVGGS